MKTTKSKRKQDKRHRCIIILLHFIYLFENIYNFIAVTSLMTNKTNSVRCTKSCGHACTFVSTNYTIHLRLCSCNSLYSYTTHYCTYIGHSQFYQKRLVLCSKLMCWRVANNIQMMHNTVRHNCLVLHSSTSSSFSATVGSGENIKGNN